VGKIESVLLTVVLKSADINIFAVLEISAVYNSDGSPDELVNGESDNDRK
jgi:hypothetical protein